MPEAREHLFVVLAAHAADAPAPAHRPPSLLSRHAVTLARTTPGISDASAAPRERVVGAVTEFGDDGDEEGERDGDAKRGVCAET
jgi:hypothetical protein